MNLIGRLILLLLGTVFNRKSFDPFKIRKNRFRVWPHDMDINIHLTAARYFSFGDLGRISWMADNNILWPFFLKGYVGVVNAQELTYIREFSPFSQVDLHIELLCWDEKYSYFQQRFYHGDKLHAIGHVRVAMLKNRSIVPLDNLFSALAFTVAKPEEPRVISDWKQMLADKKESS